LTGFVNFNSPDANAVETRDWIMNFAKTKEIISSSAIKDEKPDCSYNEKSEITAVR